MKKLFVLVAFLGAGFVYQSAAAQVLVSADIHIGNRRPVPVYCPPSRPVVVYEPVRRAYPVYYYHHRQGYYDRCNNHGRGRGNGNGHWKNDRDKGGYDRDYDRGDDNNNGNGRNGHRR